MTAFRTCHTCLWPQASCATRATLQASLAGLGITSVKHHCADYRPAFDPGDAVKVSALAWFHNDDDPPPRLWFPGYFIRLIGQRALVHVAKGAEDLSREGVQFEPHGNGYLKVPLARVADRDAPSVDVSACGQCGAILDVGDPCGADPHYTPWSKCALKERAAAREAEPTLVTATVGQVGPGRDQ